MNSKYTQCTADVIAAVIQINDTHSITKMLYENKLPCHFFSFMSI